MSSEATPTVAVVAATSVSIDAFVEPWLDRLRQSGISTLRLVGEPSESDQTSLAIGSLRRQGPLQILRSARNLRRLLTANKVDVVVSLTPFAILATRIASIGRPWTTCGAAHGTLLEAALPIRTVFKVAEAALAWTDDITVTVNENDCRFYTRLRRRRPTLLAPAGGAGFDIDRWQRVRKRRTARRSDDTVLYIGRRTSSKGLDVLEQSFHQLRALVPEAELLIVGSTAPGEPEWAPADATQIQLIDHSTQIDDYLAEAGAFCLCSPREGFPMALSEAVLSGVPAVAVQNSGSLQVRKTFGDKSVVLVEDRAEKIATALESALSESSTPDLEASAMIEVSTDAVCRFYLDVVDTLLEARGLPTVAAASPTDPA